ncbi:MAG: DUF6262 family protein [Acidimicrobiales bacterium]
MRAPERPERSTAMVATARARHDATRRRAADALRRLDAAGEDVSFVGLSRAAGVSRAWLYRDPVMRAEVIRLRAQKGRSSGPRRPVAERASDQSLRQMLEILRAELKNLREENEHLRGVLAGRLGERRAAGSSRSG